MKCRHIFGHGPKASSYEQIILTFATDVSTPFELKIGLSIKQPKVKYEKKVGNVIATNRCKESIVYKMPMCIESHREISLFVGLIAYSDLITNHETGRYEILGVKIKQNDFGYITSMLLDDIYRLVAQIFNGNNCSTFETDLIVSMLTGTLNDPAKQYGFCTTYNAIKQACSSSKSVCKGFDLLNLDLLQKREPSSWDFF